MASHQLTQAYQRGEVFARSHACDAMGDLSSFPQSHTLTQTPQDIRPQVTKFQGHHAATGQNHSLSGSEKLKRGDKLCMGLERGFLFSFVYFEKMEKLRSTLQPPHFPTPGRGTCEVQW